ncbi:MAG TPA: glycosyltransferase, partial [Pirellulaceae bacterium]
MTTFGPSRRGLRVLMLIENCPYSVDGRVRRESQALQGAGHQVTVICPRADHEPFCHDADGVRVCQYRPLLVASGAMAFLLEYAYALWSTWWLSWWVRLRYGIDVIHAHNPPDLFVLIAVCHRLVGTRFVFDHHDLAPEMFQARFGDRGSNFLLRLLVFFERCSYRFADQVIVTNESYRQLGLARSGINPARITVVRNGPEPRHFANVLPHESLRGCNATILGFVGEMGPLDGIDLLIDSLTYLAHDLGRQDWRCVLLGSGEVMDTMRTRAAQRGLAPLVQFVGRVANNEVVPYIA